MSYKHLKAPWGHHSTVVRLIKSQPGHSQEFIHYERTLLAAAWICSERPGKYAVQRHWHVSSGGALQEDLWKILSDLFSVEQEKGPAFNPASY